jgi:anti-anti-sigma regulatory factor
MAYRRCPKCWQKHGLTEATCVHCGTDLAGAELFDVAPHDPPRLVIAERAVGPVTILDLKRVLMEDRGVHELGDRIRALLDEGRRQFLVNVSELFFLDSAGFAELMRARTTVARDGGTMKLLNTSKLIGQFSLPVLCKLLLVFEFFDNEANALRSFEREGPC